MTASPAAKAPAAKVATKTVPTPAKVVTPKAPAAKAVVRTSHATCAHESKGSAGKKARAACRKERAELSKAVAA